MFVGVVMVIIWDNNNTLPPSSIFKPVCAGETSISLIVALSQISPTNIGPGTRIQGRV
jgi:hypothetical protein